MKVLLFKEPFEHVIVHSLYDDQEQLEIWKELKFFEENHLLQDNEKTGDPLSSKNKKGIVLDTYYNSNRNRSFILSNNRRIIDIAYANRQVTPCKYICHSNTDSTYLSYYVNDSYYKPHYDITVVSAVTVFYNNPKNFQGGDLAFSDYNYNPEMFHNSVIIFPSYEMHSVSKIITEEKGVVRYSICQFFSTIP